MNDPFVLLKKDHRETEQMLQRLAESNPGRRRRQTLERLEAALALHMDIEERLIYPLVRSEVDEEAEEEAEVEHQLARDGMAKLRRLVDAPGFGAAVAMVTAGIKHHVTEEEREVFPELKRSLERADIARLGDEVVDAKRKTRRPTRRAA
ncbi:MAG TPA: hemerythrin domain-containing protein [Acidimicrobiia bacterium]|nr:hemerythrin domain-containing protein [Acidimicrobiia bacterium]